MTRLISQTPAKSTKQAIFSIATIYALRMLGLCMLVPVLSLYAQTLKNSTPILIGIALGCYGLTQAAFQIPFGLLSDRFGRKPLIAIGLLLFILGSIIAALSHNIWGLILGRSLQGSGAVGSVSVALLADLTPETERTTAMAVIGITIGTAFSLAMILGPLLNNWLSIPSLFWLVLLMGITALFVLKFWVPEPAKTIKTEIKPTSSPVLKLLQNSKLFSLNMGMLFLHAIMTANFVVLPFIFSHTTHIPAHHQWEIYLPALCLTFVTVMPFLRWIRTPANQRRGALWAVCGLVFAEIFLIQFQTSLLEMILNLWIFFTAFTVLEAIIPATVSEIAPIEYRGAAMGINSTFQFMGIFLGGALSGWLFGHYQINTVLLLCAGLALFWWLIDFWKVRE